MTPNNVEFKEDAVQHQKEIMDAMMKVIDPELGIDLVNLGLIYEVSLDTEGELKILMTLTTMGCPLVDYIVMDLRSILAEFDFVQDIDVVITFNPPWTIDRMSKYARIALGIPNR